MLRGSLVFIATKELQAHASQHRILTGVLGQIGEPFGNGAVLGPANMYTYRTKDFMISSVQDYKGGHCAGQQQPWQVTYDIFASSGGTLFTHQPRNPDPGEVRWLNYLNFHDKLG